MELQLDFESRLRQHRATAEHVKNSCPTGDKLCWIEGLYLWAMALEEHEASAEHILGNCLAHVCVSR